VHKVPTRPLRTFIKQLLQPSNMLTPEQNRTVKVFTKNAQRAAGTKTLPLSAVNLDDVTIANSQIFVIGDVNRKTLPREQHWMWHQSKSRVTTEIPNGRLILTKLNPRKLKETSKVCPSYKLWICQILDVTSKGDVHFVWCEKGKFNKWSAPPTTKRGKTEKKEQQSSDTISIDDFAFLRDFVSEAVAMELGWMSAPMTAPVYFFS